MHISTGRGAVKYVAQGPIRIGGRFVGSSQAEWQADGFTDLALILR